MTDKLRFAEAEVGRLEAEARIAEALALMSPHNPESSLVEATNNLLQVVVLSKDEIKVLEERLVRLLALARELLRGPCDQCFGGGHAGHDDKCPKGAMVRTVRECAVGIEETTDGPVDGAGR